MKFGCQRFREHPENEGEIEFLAPGMFPFQFCPKSKISQLRQLKFTG